jgi:hypothetical protein
VNARRLFAVAVAGLALLAGAGFARAEEKARTDLAALKDAVARADKRGENVAAIREALTAFEKTLTKGALKPNEAPPELTELRDAVEMAARKGENVEAISKELGLVEKALTGHAYERPKPVEPARTEAAPVPPFLRRGGGGKRGDGVVIGGNPFRRGAPGFNASTITIVNGNFTIRAQMGDVNYLITGTTNGNEAPKIVIQNGEKKVIETDDLKKVSDEYRDNVENLLRMVKRRMR